MPEIEGQYAKYKGQVEFIGISTSSSGDAKDVTSFIDSAKYSWTFLHDPDDNVGTKYQAEAYPTSFFVDKNGLIRAVHIGGMSRADLENNLQIITKGDARP